MNEDDLLEYAVKNYEQGLQRNENIDSKASNQIGFVGVIVAIFGFIVGQGITVQGHSVIGILIGLGILITSIFVSLTILFPKKKIPVFDTTSYLEDIRNDRVEDKLVDVYTEMSDELIKYNFTKSAKLKISYLLTFAGIVISFIGVIVYIF